MTSAKKRRKKRRTTEKARALALDEAHVQPAAPWETPWWQLLQLATERAATRVAEGKMKAFQDDLARKDAERDQRQKLKQNRAPRASKSDTAAAPAAVDLRHEDEAAPTIQQPKMLQGTLKEYVGTVRLKHW